MKKFMNKFRDFVKPFTTETEQFLTVSDQHPEKMDSTMSKASNPAEYPQERDSTTLLNTSKTQDDLPVFEGTILGKCHKIEDFLGDGTYGLVTKCRNTETNEVVSIKVNKNHPDNLEQAKLEIFMLEQLRRLDPEKSNIVKWNGFFFDKERICLNFELLDQSLFDYLEERNNQGLPITEMRPILHQIANAVSCLSALEIVHADLKPENIMVVDRRAHPITVKLVDFGLARPVSTLVPGVCAQAQTPAYSLWYTAPEVLLDIPLNEAIDMWSLGLVAVELALGLPLYEADEEYDVLRFIVLTQGQPPDNVLDCGMSTTQYFIEEQCGERRWRFKTPEEFQYETGYQSQDTRNFIIKCLDDIEEIMTTRTGHHSDQRLLVNLIKRMLDLDASQRITASEVLQHPFFKSGLTKRSFKENCNNMTNTEDENLVLSQKLSNGMNNPQKMDCSFKSPAEYPEQLDSNIIVKTSNTQDDLPVFEGTILGKCHTIEDFLGDGTYGYVTKCRNTETNEVVAIKVNKNHPDILEQAKLEIFMLEQLRRLDPEKSNIVKWNGFFFDKERICLNFELLDQSLFDYLEERNNQGLPITEMRPILHQIANAVSCLSALEIVHADLKPENIMVVDRRAHPITVKLVDFGLARPVSTLVTGVYVQSLWYTAPEVLLDIPLNEAIDMWSLGLVAVDLALGLPLYQAHKEYDVLRFIVLTQGQPPDDVLDCGMSTTQYFIEEPCKCGERHWRFKTPEEYQYETGYQSRDTRNYIIKCLDDIEEIMTTRTGHHSDQRLLVNLIKRMLDLDASQRITASEVLQDPFFKTEFLNSIKDNGTNMKSSEDENLTNLD